MAGEWIECKLADVCRAIDYGLTAAASDDEIGPRFLRITDVASGHIDWQSVPFVAADAETTEKFRLDHGDIVLARTGASTGASGFIENPPLAVFASYLVRLKARPEFDSRFLAYYLRSDSFLNFIRGVIGDKSAQPNASASTMTKAPLRIPREFAEQKAIGQILASFDNKIELNRRMNETLEAIAKAIFKSWFVDFDPVRAKADGRLPFGIGAKIAAVFPSSFQESQIGRIPRGWNIGSLLTNARLLSGGTPKTDKQDYWSGEILWASAKDVSQCSDTFLLETERTVTQKGVAESATQVLQEFCTVVVARGATTGRMVMLGREMAMNQTCYALKSTSNSPFLLYCLLRNEMDSLVHTAHGSVFDTITTRTFESSRVILPPAPVVEAFEAQVTPLFRRILTNTKESSILADIRDSLLPRLITGEIRVTRGKNSVRGTN